MRSNGVNHSGAKVPHSNIARGKRHSQRSTETLRKEDTFQDELVRNLEPLIADATTVGRFIRRGVGLYFGTYKEVGIGIARLVSQGSRNLWQRGCALFSPSPSSNGDPEPEIEPPHSDIPQTSTNGNGSNTGNTSESKIIKREKEFRPERKYLNISIQEVNEKQPFEVAQIIIQALNSQNIAFDLNGSSRSYDLLKSIANRESSFEELALRHSIGDRFNSSLSSIKEDAIKGLNVFLQKVTANDQLASVLTHLLSSDMTSQAACVVTQDDNAAHDFKRIELALDQERIMQDYALKSGINIKVLRSFFELSEKNESILSPAEIENRIAFLQGLMNLGSTLPDNLQILRTEYSAFLEYRSSSSLHTKDIIQGLFGRVKDFSLNSFTTRIQAVKLLGDWERNKDLLSVVDFLENIVLLESLGVKGLNRLLSKAVNYKGRNICGIYKEPQVVLRIKDRFPEAEIFVSESDIGLINDLDVRVKASGIEYFVEIKGSFGTAALSIRQIKNLAQEAQNQSTNGKTVVPVCIVIKGEEELRELESCKVVEHKENKMRDLNTLFLATKNYPQFEIQNINGEVVNSRIKALFFI